MRLIDGNEVGAKIQAMYIRREMDYGGENEFCRGMRKALRIIEDAPIIEAEPVKHGRWLDYGRDNDWVKFYRCSICKDEMADTSEANFVIEKYKYCPFCGARMDGDGE